jgi:capsular exopolysaccharide synthesis family protein
VRLYDATVIAHFKETPPASFAPSPHHGPSLRELGEMRRLWLVLLQRRRLFLAVFLAFALAVIALSMLTPKTYTTSAKLIAGNPNNTPDGSDPNTALPILNALMLQNGVESAETYAALIQQDAVAAQVGDDLHLKISPGALLAHVNVRPLVNTAILELSVKWRNPQTSAQIANDFAHVFVSRERDYVGLQAASAVTFLGTELPKAERRMKRANDALATFQSAHSIVDVGAQTAGVVSRASQVDSKVDATELDGRQARALLASVQGQISSLPASIVSSRSADPNPTLLQLRTQLASVQVQLATARQSYTDAYPAVVALRKQRDELQREVDGLPASVNGATTSASNPIYVQLQQQAAGYRAQIAGDGAQLRGLRAQQTQYARILKGLPSTATTLTYLQQKAKLATDVYTALQQKLNDAEIARTTAISDVTIVQAAVPASASVSPNVKLNALLGIVLGSILATAAVFAADFFESTLRSEEDVARIVGLPVIATIPRFARPGDRALPWIRSLTAEAFLHLCTSLRLRSKDPLRKIAITSPSKGDGKSTIAFHLASAMSKLRPGVLLVDADLRRPTMHEHLHSDNAEGLSDVLAGTRTLSQVVHSAGPGLSIVTSGPTTANPVGLLQSPNFDAALDEALRTYGMIIIDTPALNAVTDAVIVSAKADATALVICANTTDERAAKTAISRLESLGVANILGVVLNCADTKFSDYGDYFTHIAPIALGEAAHD